MSYFKLPITLIILLSLSSCMLSDDGPLIFKKLTQRTSSSLLRPAPTFEYLNAAVFEPKCADCHSVTRQEGGVVLVTYEDYEDYLGEGDYDDWYLIQLLTQGDPDFDVERMPKGEPKIPQSQLNLIREWLELGAPKE